MKRLKFWMAGFVFVSLVAMIAADINLGYGTMNTDEFILTNVEALAQGEGPYENECMGSGSLVCGGGTYKIRVAR